MSELINIYRELKPKYERLRENLCRVLEQELDSRSVPIFAVESRVKDEKSFVHKVSRKGYENPTSDVEDMCGVRVICYYQEDIEKICHLIESEFNIVSEENKQEELNHDQFGYTSYHYIVTLKDSWLEHPSARGLGGFKAEIQIRTMLMHTWSAISHKLLYKREQDVDPQFKRKISRLSALIELADEQFNTIKNEREEFRKALPISDGHFETDVEVTSDSLLAIKDFYFPDRVVNEGQILSLLDEIRGLNLTVKDVVDSIERCLPILDEVEAKVFEAQNKSEKQWAFAGVMRSVLDLTQDEYFINRKRTIPPFLVAVKEPYRSMV
ncbi:GTP pyrophosphokinase [Vibrio nomapromontoriensis]|uniref:GTP pyrophosphokinase n=1 Tax=Vibrio nomapromontoriensis TaxID=2910246 RepID=UPI003D0A735F